MKEEIQEIIKKNLPQQVGETLKARLEEADQLEIKLRQVEEKIKNLSLSEGFLREELSKYRKLDERNSTLESREKELETKERNLEIETLKYQLQSEKDKIEFTKSIAQGLVRNTEYRKQVYDSDSVHRDGYTDSNGNWIPSHYVNTTKSYTETTSEE